MIGREDIQLLFDGQLYRFADNRQREIFASAPQRYSPALGGDCVVTFAETGQRAPGDLRYGLQHQQRLFFFDGPVQLERFRANPEHYADADLAHDGNCVVSKVDRRQVVAGLPGTDVTVGGLRYRFLGSHQRAQFFANLSRYGARVLDVADPGSAVSTLEGTAEKPVLAMASPSEAKLSDSSSRDQEASAPQGKQAAAPDDGDRSPADAKLAMAGYCPVSIRDKGTWEEGAARYRVAYDGHLYQFVGETEKALFAENPSLYIPALGGDCVVSLVNSKKHIAGSIYHMVAYEDRLFLFAGPEEQLLFKADPAAFADADLAHDGNCIVTLAETGETVAGHAEHLSWFQGKRYYFASDEQKAKFLANPDRYINPIGAVESPGTEGRDDSNPSDASQ